MKDFEIKKKILGFFYNNEGTFVSGEEISEKLHFSRAYTWKYISKLREDGYCFDAVPHLGYILRTSPDKLYGYDIACALRTKIFGKKAIYYYDSLSSTNDKAYEFAENGEVEGTLVIAETQTHGKGRMSRRWISPKSGGLYMSLILRPDLEMIEVPVVTLVAALAVAKAIRKTANLEAGIKWPNDIFINGRKVCGILTEIKAQPDKVDFLILGIGINVNTPISKLPDTGTSLAHESAREIRRTTLVRSVLEEFEDNYTRLKKEGFLLLRKECRELSLVLGKHVKVEEHHQHIEGLAVDLDENGALLVRKTNGVLQRVFSGDVKI